MWMADIQHIPNLQLIQPRYNHCMYHESPKDAHVLQCLMIPDSHID